VSLCAASLCARSTAHACPCGSLLAAARRPTDSDARRRHATNTQRHATNTQRHATNTQRHATTAALTSDGGLWHATARDDARRRTTTRDARRHATTTHDDARRTTTRDDDAQAGEK
jgi:hypothetical protein